MVFLSSEQTLFKKIISKFGCIKFFYKSKRYSGNSIATNLILFEKNTFFTEPNLFFSCNLTK